MKIFNEILYNGRQKCDMYLPDTPNFKTIVYFHGGGLVEGTKDGIQIVDFGKIFAENGYGFVSANYSLYTQGGKYPDYLNDCADCIKFVKENIKNYGGNGDIIVSGQSAGAWISLMLCLNKQFLQARNLSPSEIKGWIIDSSQTTSHFNVIHFESGIDSRKQVIDKFAPLYYVDENTAFSKMLLIYYENDMPCRLEQNLLFHKAVLSYNPNANIEKVMLSGTHCHGSSIKNEDGTYDYVTTSLSWLKNNKL